MATTAEFTVAARDFPLGSSFESLSDVTIELEKIIPTNTAVVPYLWVRGVEVTEVRAVLESHRATQEVTLVESIKDRHLLRVDWNPTHEGFLHILVEAKVVLLSASGTAAEWNFLIRGDSHESISNFQTYCQEAGIPIELLSLSELSSADAIDVYGLTDTQREALLLAYERGYFDSPRRTTLQDIAEELGITRQALASRLRRGHRHLIEQTLGSP